MTLKTLSAKFHSSTIEAVKRKCELLNCSKSTYLRWCVIRTNDYVNKSLVYPASDNKTDDTDIKPLEKYFKKILTELDALMGKEPMDED
jgi:hypothetical protein